MGMRVCARGGAPRCRTLIAPMPACEKNLNKFFRQDLL